MTDTSTTMVLHPRPAGGRAVPWDFPAPERGTLPNGVTVLRAHRPGQQVIAVEVVIRTPLAAEPEGLEGVATIMARALNEGTDQHSAEEFAAELERCGADLEAHADHAALRVSLEVPASRLGRALALLAETLRAPAFRDEDVERLVRNRLDEIPHETANPARRAARELFAELFPAGSRLSRPRQGTEESIARIGAAEVRAHYAAQVRPGAATAVVVGDLTGIDLDGLLRDTLGTWTGGEPALVQEAPVAVADTGRIVIVDRPGSVQTHILAGRGGPDRHAAVWPAQTVGVYCLGGTLTSRLDLVLREEKGYTYGVRAFAQVLRSSAAGDGIAMTAISGSVATDVTAPAVGDLYAVLRRLSEDGLTDEERDFAVQNLVGTAPLRYETAAAVAGALADQAEEELADDFQAGLYARLADTGTVEATAAVVQAFPPDRLVTVLVGDADQIAGPVKELGLGEVTVVAA